MTVPTDIASETVPDVPVSPLTLADRCDRCHAQAFVKASILTEAGLLPLLFCAHHYKAHEAKLTALAAVIQDESHMINQKPGEAPR